MTQAAPLVAQVANDVLSISEFLLPATLITRSPGSRNEYGEWVRGGETRLDIDVVLVPGVKDRKALPEGLDDKELVTIYYHGEIESLRAGMSDGDIVILNGRRYRAIMVERWNAYTVMTGEKQSEA